MPGNAGGYRAHRRARRRAPTRSNPRDLPQNPGGGGLRGAECGERQRSLCSGQGAPSPRPPPPLRGKEGENGIHLGEPASRRRLNPASSLPHAFLWGSVGEGGARHPRPIPSISPHPPRPAAVAAEHPHPRRVYLRRTCRPRSGGSGAEPGIHSASAGGPPRRSAPGRAQPPARPTRVAARPRTPLSFTARTFATQIRRSPPAQGMDMKDGGSRACDSCGNVIRIAGPRAFSVKLGLRPARTGTVPGAGERDTAPARRAPATVKTGAGPATAHRSPFPPLLCADHRHPAAA
jgi:hypothetical protein